MPSAIEMLKLGVYVLCYLIIFAPVLFASAVPTGVFLGVMEYLNDIHGIYIRNEKLELSVKVTVALLSILLAYGVFNHYGYFELDFLGFKELHKSQ